MKKRICLSGACIIGVLLLATSIPAAEFQPIGFNALSMGGAGVASSIGSFAPYYNPALLADHKNTVEISISGGVGIREINLVDTLDTLSDIDVEDTIDRVKNTTPSIEGGNVKGNIDPAVRENIKTIKSELINLSDQNGLQICPATSVGIQVLSFGFGFFGISEGTAHGVIDKTRLDIIVEKTIGGAPPEFSTAYVKYDVDTDLFTPATLAQYQQSSLQYAMDEGYTYVQLTGLSYAEIPISYGYRFDTSMGTFNVGGSLKIMPAYTYDKEVKIDTASGDIQSELNDAKETDTSFGIDLGFLYRPTSLQSLAVGLVMKNINTPKFDTTTNRELEVKPQVRAGVAYDLSSSLTLALDMDLTKNATFLPDYDSQFIGGGVNYHPFNWLSVRGGLMQNIQESNDGTVLTGGFGFGIKWLQVDLAGQYSLKQGEFDGNTIPRYGRVQMSLVSKW
ncbi:MAG: conjugal transfer protein TraF [Deltaproteobacteria bacterium]|nr:conjugal transfer protein TraF [Deltaproteobacteria bacterium]